MTCVVINLITITWVKETVSTCLGVYFVFNSDLVELISGITHGVMHR